MTILVAYASRYGATQETAERIAETLRAAGQDVVVKPMKAAGDPASYDAVVLGSAVYYGSWLKEATAFVRRHHTLLASRPVWLFSSGPIGPATADDQGQDLRTGAEPRQIAEFAESIRPRDNRVFFGKLDRGRLGFLDRLVASMPAFPGAEGDFRDWAEIEAWANAIARELASAPVGGR